MKTFTRIVAAALVMAPALTLAQTSTWAIDPVHSRDSFSIRHLVISNVRGKMSGTLTLDEKDITQSKVEATIEATTIDTREAKRDDHLRSAEFFDVAKYPTISFKSTKVERTGKDELKVTGDLTMHGVTKMVVLKVAGPTAAIQDPWGMARRGVSASTRINRMDYGVSWSQVAEGGGAVVGNEVNVDLDVELVKK
jgi:polyisoprenoid-binding protein YceI